VKGFDYKRVQWADRPCPGEDAEAGRGIEKVQEPAVTLVPAAASDKGRLQVR